MADEEKGKEEKAPEKEESTSEKEESQQGGKKTGLVAWIIMIVAVTVLSGSGFVLGRLFAGPSSSDESASSQETVESENSASTDIKSDSEEIWYYHLEPVVANLDEPGVTRYVQATITMEISANWDKIEAEAILANKRFLLKDWLATYLASLTLEDTRGDKNLNRIKLQILDAFNETLFPDSRPQIKRILFKEGFAVQ